MSFCELKNILFWALLNNNYLHKVRDFR